MTALLTDASWAWTLGSNLSIATLLGGLGWIAIRRGSPTWAHTLYLLALIKLITPSLFALPLWTEELVVQAAADQASASAALPTSDGATNALAAAPTASSWSIWDGIAVLWIGGTLASLALAATRITRFSRWAKTLRTASETVRREVETLGARMGIPASAVPRVLVTTRAVSPLICLTLRGPLMVLPAELLRTFDTPARHTMLVHELAHWRRSDWIARVVEILAVAAWWWLPIAYSLRRRLREAEELCCDAWVTSELPNHEAHYAGALLQAAELVTRRDLPIPSHAMSMARTHNLETRVTMMMTTHTKRSLTAWSRALAIGIAAASLPLTATLAQSITVLDVDRAGIPSPQAITKNGIRLTTPANADALQVLTDLSASAKLNIVVDAAVQELDRDQRNLQAIRVENSSVTAILDHVCANTRLSWTLEEGNIIRIGVRPERFQLLGAVATPGPRRLAEGTSLLDLMTDTNLLPSSDLGEVLIARSAPERPISLRIDVREMRRTGDTLANVLIEDGDVVFVPGGRVVGIKRRRVRIPAGLKPFIVNKSMVGVGDLVSCFVDPYSYRLESTSLLKMLNTPQKVGAEGTIFVPYVGSVRVLGLGREQVEAAVLAKLNEMFAEPIQMTVRVSEGQ